jgi:hypothetical protein
MSDQREQLLEYLQSPGLTTNQLADFILARERRITEPIMEVYDEYKSGLGITAGRMLEAIKTTVEGVGDANNKI